MRKIIIATAVIFSTGILSICTKNNCNQASLTMIQRTVFDCKKELASGD